MTDETPEDPKPNPDSAIPKKDRNSRGGRKKDVGDPNKRMPNRDKPDRTYKVGHEWVNRTHANLPFEKIFVNKSEEHPTGFPGVGQIRRGAWRAEALRRTDHLVNRPEHLDSPQIAPQVDSIKRVVHEESGRVLGHIVVGPDPAANWAQAEGLATRIPYRNPDPFRIEDVGDQSPGSGH
jgi:hypothetical protein